MKRNIWWILFPAVLLLAAASGCAGLHGLYSIGAHECHYCPASPLPYHEFCPLPCRYYPTHSKVFEK